MKQVTMVQWKMCSNMLNTICNVEESMYLYMIFCPSDRYLLLLVAVGADLKPIPQFRGLSRFGDLF